MIDPDTLKYAQTLYDQQFRDEIQPRYRSRVREAVARWNPNPQRLFSGSQAQILVKVHAQYASESARAKAESLITALDKSGLAFDDEAFRKGMEDTKILLEKHSEYSYRQVIEQFNVAALPPGTAKAVEQDIDNEMRHIHDSILLLFKVKLQESILSQRALKQQSNSADLDRKFTSLAIAEARLSVSEQDGKPHPKVGAVVVKDGQVLSTAHRGEEPGNHAEFVALEKKLPDEALAGATIYTTLEPCTTRNAPKVPCVKRIVERKVARVVIGMVDPDPRITGRGILALRRANIAVAFFPHDLMTEIEELNREFKRLHEEQGQPQQVPVADVKLNLQDYLSRFANQKRQVFIEPLLPASENSLFLVHDANSERVVVKKLSSSQLISIPTRRISEIFFGVEVDDPPTLHLDGRLQWITVPNEWKFFAETPLSTEDAHLGFPKAVGGLQDPHVRQVEQQLRERSYQGHWFRRDNLPVLGGGSNGRGWQLFYDADGRFLVLRNSNEVLVLAVQWNFSG